MDINELIKHQDEYPLSPADPEEIPQPTFWPVFLAFGVLLLFWGLISSLIMSAIGALVVAVSVSGWVSDLNNS